MTTDSYYVAVTVIGRSALNLLRKCKFTHPHIKYRYLGRSQGVSSIAHSKCSSKASGMPSVALASGKALLKAAWYLLGTTVRRDSS